MPSSCDYPLELNPCYFDSPPDEVCPKTGRLNCVLNASDETEYPCLLPYTFYETDGIRNGELIVDCSQVKDVWEKQMIEDLDNAARFYHGFKAFEITTIGL